MPARALSRRARVLAAGMPVESVGPCGPVEGEGGVVQLAYQYSSPPIKQQGLEALVLRATPPPDTTADPDGYALRFDQ